MPSSSDPKSLDYTWTNKIDTTNTWSDYGNEKSPTFQSSMNYDGKQTFTKSEYSLNAYNAIGTPYRFGPDVVANVPYNQPSCYTYVNVNRTAVISSPTTTIATTMPTTIMSTTSQQVTTTVATKKGDFNNDNNINIQDLSILLGHLGATGIQSNNIYDLNKDNSIDVKDLSILLSLLGK